MAQKSRILQPNSRFAPQKMHYPGLLAEKICLVDNLAKLCLRFINFA